jgi:hypothetical protein
MGEGLEGLDVPLARVELVKGERRSLVSYFDRYQTIKPLSSPRTPRPAIIQPAPDVAAGSVTRTRVALAGAALDDEGAAVGGDQMLDDGEPEPGSA